MPSHHRAAQERPTSLPPAMAILKSRNRASGVPHSCTPKNEAGRTAQARASSALNVETTNNAEIHDNPTIENSDPLQLSQQGAASRKENQSPENGLPHGCVQGVVLPVGAPVSLIDDDPETIDASILLCIQDDNYKYLRYMILNGWKPVPVQSCCFQIALQHEGQRLNCKIENATPLHYALCCSKFKTTAAFLIGLPEQLDLKCTVSFDDQATQEFSALDLALFFHKHFASLRPSLSTLHALAAKVLNTTACHLKNRFPGSGVERIRPFEDGEEAISALVIATLKA